jgi:hypothetical protein
MKGSLLATNQLRRGGLLAAMLYLALGMADLALSRAAFHLGVAEGNPMLAFMARHGLFVPAKVALTVLAAVLMVIVYRSPRARLVCWAGVALMALVDAYHVIGLVVELPLR